MTATPDRLTVRPNRLEKAALIAASAQACDQYFH
jgi:hypothetical protein